MKFFIKNLNADAQEFDGATAVEATATPKAPEQIEQPMMILIGALTNVTLVIMLKLKD